MIRKICYSDRDEYIKMAEDFYASPAVSHPIPKNNFENAFNAAISGDPCIKIYIFEKNGETAGYAALALTYTTEGGGKTVWLDELYVREDFRGNGLGKDFIEFLKSDNTIKRIRLEITPENDRAKKLYSALGFYACDYKQMIFDRPIRS